jgi:hypothetical protein
LRFHHPVGQTVSAETGKAHQVDIFRIMAMLQVRDQPTKGGCRGGVADGFVNWHSYVPFPLQAMIVMGNARRKFQSRKRAFPYAIS